MSEKKSVLVVTPSEAIIETVQETFNEKLRGRVITAQNATEMRLKVGNQDFDYILLDIDLANMDYQDFIEGMRRKESQSKERKQTPILFIGSDIKQFQTKYVHFDTCFFLTAPFVAEELVDKIKEFTKTATTNKTSQKTQHVPEGEFLLREGEQSNEMFWVVSGKFKITKSTHQGIHIEVGEVTEGELIGEMSFLDDCPRSASVRAMVDSEVLVIPHGKFVEILEKQPRWFKGLMQTLSTRIRNANEIIARRFSEDLEEDKARDTTRISGA